MTNFKLSVISIAEQIEVCARVKTQNGVLLTEWVAPSFHEKSPTTLWYTLYLIPQDGLLCVCSPLDPKKPALVNFDKYFPVSGLLQRAIRELTRISTAKTRDKRLWLNHGHFPLGVLNDHSSTKSFPTTAYPFKKVSGDGVHEIPVGPVHAGIIEPGHFRFSVVGERILKCESRLGYTHKGIHSLLKNKTFEDGAKIIGRVSGDSTVAYAYAFALACEHAVDYKIAPVISLQRALFLERERLANHLGDIGAIINDAGLPSLQSLFNILKEQLLRHNQHYANHRYLMDSISPFHTKIILSSSQLEAIKIELNSLHERLIELQMVAENHAGLQDRLQTTGVLTTDNAKKLGVVGLTAKASGIDLDSRRILRHDPYQEASLSEYSFNAGDVAARVSVRFKECFESMGLIHHFIEKWNGPRLHVNAETSSNQKSGIGYGCVEGWRGPIVVIVSIDNNKIEWCHFHDPSWQNWQALEYAVMDNIVADFPLINKSFNLSYSGHDS